MGTLTITEGAGRQLIAAMVIVGTAEFADFTIKTL